MRHIFTIAMGQWKYVRQGIANMLACRKACDDSVKISLITEYKELTERLLDRGIEVIKPPKLLEGKGEGTFHEGITGYLGMKLNVFDRVDGDICLFIDTDCQPMRKFPEVWDLLESDKEIGMTIDYGTMENSPRPGNSMDSLNKTVMMTPEEEAYCIPTYADAPMPSTGFMLYKRTEKMRELFSKAYNEWMRFRNNDEAGMARALYDNPDLWELFQELPKKYNHYYASWRSRDVVDPEDVFVHSHQLRVLQEEWPYQWELSDTILRSTGLTPNRMKKRMEKQNG